MLISVFIIKLSLKCGVSGNWRAVFYVNYYYKCYYHNMVSIS